MPRKQLTSEFTGISLFSGGGGLDLGLAEAGVRTLAAVEWERHACETLERNKKERRVIAGEAYLRDCSVLQRDVRDVTGPEILRTVGMASGEVTLLVGGPSCVSFSIAGGRAGLRSESGKLYLEFVRLLRSIRPKAFIFENVRGLLSAPGLEGSDEPAFEAIVAGMMAAGYALTWRSINAADYGVPQHRHRVIVLGRRGRTPFGFPEETHTHPEKAAGAMRPWRTVRDAISDLPSPAMLGEAPTFPNHVARRHSPRVIASLAATAPGKRNPIYKRDRLRWDEPAKTVRAQGKPKADGSGSLNSSHQSIHPTENRQITVREAARLQTFPDWYSFDETLVNGYRVVGDAVPPLLARILASSVLTQLLSTDAETARVHTHPSRTLRRSTRVETTVQ